MAYEFETDFNIDKGEVADIYTEFQRPYSSPTLEDIKTKTTNAFVNGGGKKGTSLADLDTGSSTDTDYDGLTEERIDAELDNLDDEDYAEFAALIIAGLDWGFEKILNNFLNRKQTVETQAQKTKLRRMKIIGTKILIKHSVKFKIEFLFAAMFIGYGVSRYNSAEIIDKEKEASKKKKKKGKSFWGAADAVEIKKDKRSTKEVDKEILDDDYFGKEKKGNSIADLDEEIEKTDPNKSSKKNLLGETED